MLDYLEIDMEVLDTSMETAESNDCRGLLRDDGGTNSVLTMTRGETRFSYKNEQSFINPFTQSISGLC